ncbi:hypothetical protein ACIP10_15505 [Streptomyces galbus]|uniref:hypothetical protein n=1 Tax=Streptomyces galbus TaxID=33898 RepID=UPI0037A9DDEE
MSRWSGRLVAHAPTRGAAGPPPHPDPYDLEGARVYRTWLLLSATTLWVVLALAAHP